MSSLVVRLLNLNSAAGTSRPLFSRNLRTESSRPNPIRSNLSFRPDCVILSPSSHANFLSSSRPASVAGTVFVVNNSKTPCGAQPNARFRGTGTGPTGLGVDGTVSVCDEKVDCKVGFRTVVSLMTSRTKGYLRVSPSSRTTGPCQVRGDRFDVVVRVGVHRMYLQPEWLHATSVKLGFITFHTALGAADIGADRSWGRCPVGPLH